MWESFLKSYRNRSKTFRIIVTKSWNIWIQNIVFDCERAYFAYKNIKTQIKRHPKMLKSVFCVAGELNNNVCKIDSQNGLATNWMDMKSKLKFENLKLPKKSSHFLLYWYKSIGISEINKKIMQKIAWIVINPINFVSKSKVKRFKKCVAPYKSKYWQFCITVMNRRKSQKVNILKNWIFRRKSIFSTTNLTSTKRIITAGTKTIK